MTFDCTLPFVKSVYLQVEAGDLDVCVQFLEEYLSSHPKTPMHWIVGKSFTERMPDYADWLMAKCDRIEPEKSGFAIATSMGEFEINFDPWLADAMFYPAYDDSISLDQWLQGSHEGRHFLGDDFNIHGLDPLQVAFRYHNYGDPPLEGIAISPEVFTAVSYLMYVRFLQMVRAAHLQAAQKNHRLATVPVFCDYGDLFYLSRPTNSI